MSPRELTVQELKQRKQVLFDRVNEVREEYYGRNVILPWERCYLSEIDYRHDFDNVYPLPELWTEIEIITAEIKNKTLLKKRSLEQVFTDGVTLGLGTKRIRVEEPIYHADGTLALVIENWI